MGLMTNKGEITVANIERPQSVDEVVLIPPHFAINSFPEHFEIAHEGHLSHWKFVLNGELYGHTIDTSWGEEEIDRELLTDMLLDNMSESYDIILSGEVYP